MWKDPSKLITLALSLLTVHVVFCAASAEAPGITTPPPVAKGASVTASDGGFILKSDDGAYSLRLRAHVQVDTRTYFEDDDKFADTFFLRSARPFIEGTLFGFVDYRLMPDFAQGKTLIQDAYVKVRPVPWLQLTGGKMKAPFGLERLQVEAATYLTERGYPTSLSPNRDIGFVLSSELFDNALTLEFGIFDGQADNTLTDGDVTDDKDIVARVFARPFAPLNLTGLNGFGIGAAVTWGIEDSTGVEPNKYSTPGQQSFFTHVPAVAASTTTDALGVETTVPATSAALADGDRLRVTGQLQYNVEWFGLLAEATWVRHSFAKGAEKVTLEHLGWQAVADFCVFGGKSSFEGVKPDKPLTLATPGPGAFNLTVRFTELYLDEGAFPTFADPAKSAKFARSYGGALSWWANRALRVIVDFSRTDFEGGAKFGDRASENILTTRLQLSF